MAHINQYMQYKVELFDYIRVTCSLCICSGRTKSNIFSIDTTGQTRLIRNTEKTKVKLKHEMCIIVRQLYLIFQIIPKLVQIIQKIKKPKNQYANNCDSSHNEQRCNSPHRLGWISWRHLLAGFSCTRLVRDRICNTRLERQW